MPRQKAAARERELVFLFDVDNTLLDNDRVTADLLKRFSTTLGERARSKYVEIFEKLRKELGYADYLGALERYRLEDLHESRILTISNWFVDYPFRKRLFPRVFGVIQRVRRWGQIAILSDGDAVFQPRKIARSGLWKAFSGNVMIYIHKEQMLSDVELLYPARHYVMVDDKLRILEAIKNQWGGRVTTVFPKQGHYAHDAKANAQYRPADISVNRIADLLKFERTDFLGA